MRDGWPSSEADLVRRARNGDADAFRVLVQRNQDHVYNVAFHLVGNPEDAEDIAQEVFVRAYSKLNGFAGRAKFSTWLYGIMLNAVRSYWRRQRGRAALSLEGPKEQEEGFSADPPARGDTPADAAMRRERVRLVQEAIVELDAELREIVVLRDIQGLSYADLAQALRVPGGTVKSRLHRARRALKDRLEPLFGQRE